MEISEIISETDDCKISITSLRGCWKDLGSGKPKAGPPHSLQGGCTHESKGRGRAEPPWSCQEQHGPTGPSQGVREENAEDRSGSRILGTCHRVHLPPPCAKSHLWRQLITQHTIQVHLYVHNRGKWLCCWDQSFNLMPLTPL